MCGGPFAGAETIAPHLPVVTDEHSVYFGGDTFVFLKVFPVYYLGVAFPGCEGYDAVLERIFNFHSFVVAA